jgi:hypothetical protein
MHTTDDERAVDELARVVAPGGWLYLLAYATGGLRWPLIQLLRPLGQHLGQASLERAVARADLPANKRRTFLDDLLTPRIGFYSWERLSSMLRRRGFAKIERWGRAPRLDHEASLAAYRADLESLHAMLRAGDAEEFGAERALYAAGAQAVDAALATIRFAEAQVAAGRLSEPDGLELVVGQGHHRLIATKPG